MLFRCEQGCEVDIGMTRARNEAHFCTRHNAPMFYAKGLGRSEKTAAPRKRSTLKRGRGFAASPEQQEKVKGLVCVGCGREASEYVAIDPAHLFGRNRFPCSHSDGVIPLCRTYEGGCHRDFDEGRLSVLERLIDNGYWVELAHPIICHEVSPLTLLEQVTNQEWVAV